LKLEQILFSQGFGTRKTCRILIQSKRVNVNGALCEDPYSDFEPNGMQFGVDDEIWQFREKTYIVMNKPAGYECSNKPKHHTSIYTLFPSPLRGRNIQSIGRLDEDTTGLLVFSDDGQFIHRMESPRWKVPKVYEVTTKHPVNSDRIAALCKGVMLDDEPVPVAALSCKQLSDCLIELTIGEGKYHQVKRMIAAIGNRAESLKRISIGRLELPKDLAPGQWRFMTEDELGLLKMPQ
jgi:16S rRNA pseudouridine516 synthase